MPLYKGRTAWDSRVFPAATGSTGGSVTVTHDADGSNTVTVYDASYNHKLEIKNGNSVYLALEGLTWTKGRTQTAITLTAARRETLLTAMKSLKSFTGTFALTTYGGSAQIGAVSTKTVAVQTTAANSAPTLSGFTYADSNGATAAVTGNETVMIQGHSVLRITPGTAAAKNFAEISGYTASCDGVNVSGASGGALSLGSVSKSGQVTVTLTATDTRGYTASASKTVTVVPYSPPKVSSLTLRRTNDIEAEMQLKFSGSISAVSVDGAAKNALQTVRYRYKKTSESSYGSYVSVLSAVARNGTSFDYSNLQLTSLDANSSYDFHIQIQDKLGTASSLDLYYVVPQGTPLIALRKQKVGVNNPNPAAALDVTGDIVISGAVTLGSIPHTAFKDTKKAAIMVEDLSEPGDYFFPLYSVKVKQGTWRVGVYSLQNKPVAVFTKLDGTYHWEPLVDGSTWV